MPEQMPQNTQSNQPLLSLQQQQQLILQQLQTSQPGTAGLPSQLGFCGMGDLPQPGNPPGGAGAPSPAPAPGGSMPQFQNQQLRMQGLGGCGTKRVEELHHLAPIGSRKRCTQVLASISYTILHVS